jgi:hypothetical protein
MAAVEAEIAISVTSVEARRLLGDFMAIRRRFP